MKKKVVESDYGALNLHIGCVSEMIGGVSSVARKLTRKSAIGI